MSILETPSALTDSFQSMEVEEDRSPDELHRPEGNDLQSNYEKHDTGQSAVRGMLEENGILTENWGIDMREETDDLIFDDKMDLKVYRGEDIEYNEETEGWQKQVSGIVEIKTKSRDWWMLKCNERHWEDYSEIAEQFDVPVFVVFINLDDMSQKWVRVGESDVVDRFKFPDMNDGVKVEQTHSPQEAMQIIHEGE